MIFFIKKNIQTVNLNFFKKKVNSFYEQKTLKVISASFVNFCVFFVQLGGGTHRVVSQIFTKSKSRKITLIQPLLLGTLFLFFFSCQNPDKRNIKNYYYPLDNWTQGVVYEYHSVNDDSPPIEFWFFEKIKTDTATYLTGKYFDHNFTVKQYFKAEVVSNGVLMDEYSLIEYDSLGNASKRPAEILAANSFPFEVKDSTSLFLFKLRWQNPTVKDAYLELVRNRRFQGDTIYFFKNKPYDCVAFKIKELMDDYNDGHLEKQYDGKEIYAKGLGLVYYGKEIEENFVLEYELVDTFSRAIFEQKIKNNYWSEK